MGGWDMYPIHASVLEPGDEFESQKANPLRPRWMDKTLAYVTLSRPIG